MHALHLPDHLADGDMEMEVDDVERSALELEENSRRDNLHVDMTHIEKAPGLEGSGSIEVAQPLDGVLATYDRDDVEHSEDEDEIMVTDA